MSNIVEFATHTASVSQNSNEGARNRRTKSAWAGATASLGFALMGVECDGPGGSKIRLRMTPDGGGVDMEVPIDLTTPNSQATAGIYAFDWSILAQPIAFVEDGLIVEGSAVGSSKSDYLIGGTEDQILFGSGGDDILEGRGGADTLDGGEGTDTASYASSALGVIVNLLTQEARNGDAENDNLANIENLVGSEHRDELTGDQKPNALYGLGGNDEIHGGKGNDLLVGGKGDDDLYGGAGNDRYFVSPDEGTDTIVDTEGNNEVYFLSDADSRYVATDFDADNFSQNGDDLVVSVTKGGKSQQVTIEDYFVSIANNADAFTIYYRSSDQGSDYTEVTATDIASYV